MTLMYHAAVDRVTPNDADELAELDAQLFPEGCFNETTLRQEIQIGRAWGIRVNERFVAFVLVAQDGPTGLADIIRLGVHPDQRRHGLGRQLLEKVLEEFPKTMLTVRRDNTLALGMYLRRGFKIVGLLAAGNAWVMTRDVIPTSAAS